jgi:hypothetical protein
VASLCTLRAAVTHDDTGEVGVSRSHNASILNFTFHHA